MCIFSKTIVDVKPPPSRPKKPFDFKVWCDKEINKISHSIQENKVDKLAHECRLILLSTYGIFPPKFDLQRALSYSGAALGIGTAAGVGVPVAGTAAGFTSSGIAAGSIAAGVQSSIGSVAAGSTFATLQSIGATGGFAILGPISLIAGAVGITIAGSTFLGIGIDKHIKEIDSFAERTYLILPHV